MPKTLPPININIVIPIYDKVNLFDVTSACEMFYWMGYFLQEKKGRIVTLALVEAEGRTVKTHAGPRLVADGSFADYRGKNGQPKKQAQLIWVPGASDDTTEKMMNDSDYLSFLQEQAPGAEYVTSVCEGAMLLAAAGLLKGYKATTHWGMVPCLKRMKGVKVARGYPRFVVDRNRVTGGGVSSGVDESLEVIRLIAGQKIAEQVQVVTQYFPKPPVKGKIPKDNKCDIKIPGQNKD